MLAELPEKGSGLANGQITETLTVKWKLDTDNEKAKTYSVEIIIPNKIKITNKFEKTDIPYM